MKKFFTLALALVMFGASAFAQVNTTTQRIPAEKMTWVKSTVNQTSNLAYKAVKDNGSQNAIKAVSPINQFPYTEGFENGLTDWTLVDNGNPTGYGWDLASVYLSSATGIAHSGVDCAVSKSYDNNYGVIYPDNWMISQEIQIPANSTFELSWYDAAQDANYPAEYYSVYIATSNTVAALSATTPVFSVTLSSNVWTKRTVDLTSYAGQNVFIAFRHHNCSDMFYLKIDDVRVGGPTPPDITIAGNTAGFVNDPMTFTAVCSDTAAAINWTIQGGTPDTAITTIVNVTWAAGGTYIVKASATNAYGTSSDSISVSILDCTGVVAIPFVESFENGMGCWTTIDADGDGNDWVLNAPTGGSYDGNYCMRSKYSSTVTNDQWLISPQIVIPNDSAAYQLSWYAKAQSASYPEDYEVHISTTGGASTTNFTSVFSEILSETSWVKRTVSLAAYAGDTINVAFRHTAFDQYYLCIDYVRVTAPMAPESVAISGPAMVQTNVPTTYIATCDDATATYAWTIQGGTPATATGDTITVEWATAGTYTVTVTATNAAGSISETLNVTAIACEAITTFPYTMGYEETEDLSCWMFVDADGDGFNWDPTYLFGQGHSHSGDGMISSASYNGSALNPDNWMISPNFEIPAGSTYTLSWFDAAQDASYAADHYAVYIATTNTVAGFTATTAVFEVTLSTNAWTKRVIDLTSYAGQSIYVAFRHYNCYDMFWMKIDDFRIGTPEAPEVTIDGPTFVFGGQMVTFTAVSSTAQSFAWTIDGQASTETSNTLVTSFTLAGTHTISVTATNAAGSTTESIEVEVAVWGDQMYYDNGVFVDCIGNGSSVYWGVKFEASALAGRNYLTSVDLYVNEIGTYTLNVYQDGDNAPANMIYSQTSQIANAGQWYTYTFNPVTLDVTKNLWVTFYCDDVAYPAAGCSYTGFPNGTYISTDGVDWAPLQEIVASLQYTWMIRATTTGLGTTETLVSGTAVYPNPTTGMLHINAQGVQEIQVIDLNGSVVSSQTEGTSVNIGNLSSGIYMVRIITENGVSMHKVVKE